MKALIIAPQLEGDFFHEARDAVENLCWSISRDLSTVSSDRSPPVRCFAGKTGVASFCATPRAYDLLVLALPASVQPIALRDREFHKQLACGIPVLALCEDLTDVAGQVGPVAKPGVSVRVTTISGMSDPAWQARIAGMIGDWTARPALPRPQFGKYMAPQRPVISPPGNKKPCMRQVLRQGNVFQIV